MKTKKFFALIIALSMTTTYSFAEPISEITDENIKFLVFGKSNKYIKQLQEFFNENGFNDCEEGPGSPGEETESFGTCTEKAIRIFQEYQEIPVTGKIDAKTAAEINTFIKETEAEYEDEESVGIDEDYLSEEAIDENYLENELDDAYSGKAKDVTDYYNTGFVQNENNETGTMESKTEKGFFTTFFEKITGINSPTYSQQDDQTKYKSLVKTIWDAIFNR